jgi:hypothetical protein
MKRDSDCQFPDDWHPQRLHHSRLPRRRKCLLPNPDSAFSAFRSRNELIDEQQPLARTTKRKSSAVCERKIRLTRITSVLCFWHATTPLECKPRIDLRSNRSIRSRSSLYDVLVLPHRGSRAMQRIGEKAQKVMELFMSRTAMKPIESIRSSSQEEVCVRKMVAPGQNECLWRESIPKRSGIFRRIICERA